MTLDEIEADLKAQQARINRAESHGPVTTEGKYISSRNAIWHGMTANLAELRMVEKIANHDWRLERFIMLETSLLNMRADSQLEEIQRKYERMDGIGMIEMFCKMKKTRIAESRAGDQFENPPYEQPPPSYDQQNEDMEPEEAASSEVGDDPTPTPDRPKELRPSGSGFPHKSPETAAQRNEPEPIPKRPRAA